MAGVGSIKWPHSSLSWLCKTRRYKTVWKDKMAASKSWKHNVAEKTSSFLLKTVLKISVEVNFSHCYTNKTFLNGVVDG